MAMGFAIQFKNGQDVLMRIYPDVHLKGGNINLERAKQLNPEVTELTLENAGELATQVGVKVRVRCETEAKFTELLNSTTTLRLARAAAATAILRAGSWRDDLRDV